MSRDNILELIDINKSFPGVKALSNVNFNLARGEVHGLIGENGAGKSTLMKILSGAYIEDSGRIVVNGEEVRIDSPKDSETLGISIIYQELNLIQKMSVAENIFLGRYPREKATISWKQMIDESQRIFDEFNIDIDPSAMLRELSIAQQQIVEIVKAISKDSKIVIMDEPTSSLTNKETEILFSIIDTLKSRQIAVVFITHRLEEIYKICDRITVLRDGEYIGTRAIQEVTKDEMIEMMIGRKLIRQFPDRTPNIREVVFEVKNLSDGGNRVKNVSFDARSGEIIGISGLVGAGRTETLRLIFGVDKKTEGEILIDGKQVEINSPQDSIEHGIGFVTENRKEEGLLLGTSVAINISLANLDRLLYNNVAISYKKISEIANHYVDLLNIKTPNISQKTNFLSGGNQQKVVLAKWLFSDSRILFFDEPTRGIDVGAKKEIYELINELAYEGKVIIVVSSELEEIMGICDRAIVMREGYVVGEVNREDFSQSLLTRYAVEGKDIS